MIITFKFMKAIFGDKVDLLCQKGECPYEWIDTIETFKYVGLPPEECWYSTLAQTHITKARYAHEWTVYMEMGRTCMGDYKSVYLRADVVLLADISKFKRFMHGLSNTRSSKLHNSSISSLGCSIIKSRNRSRSDFRY